MSNKFAATRMTTSRKVRFALSLLIGVALLAQVSLAQRDEDDFDDSSFDDNNYNQPNRDADGSSNSQNYSPGSNSDDLDDDDDVDETHVSPQVAPDATYSNGNNNQDGQEYEQAAAPMQQQQQQQQPLQQQQHYGQPQPQQQVYYANVAPQRFYSAPNSVLLANMDPNYAGQSHQQQHQRYRRSTEGDVEEAVPVPLSRQKRSHKYIGPVYTYVKTDKHARYKWGVKHKVGKHHG